MAQLEFAAASFEAAASPASRQGRRSIIQGERDMSLWARPRLLPVAEHGFGRGPPVQSGARVESTRR
eukprot:7731069-Pyramimonas_sp.AAC.1